jgi:hypothetical protein
MKSVRDLQGIRIGPEELDSFDAASFVPGSILQGQALGFKAGFSRVKVGENPDPELEKARVILNGKLMVIPPSGPRSVSSTI